MARADLSELRPAVEADLERWLAVYEAVAAEGRWIGAEAPVDREAVARRFTMLVDEERPGTILVAEADGTLIGDVSIRMERGVADIAMMVAAGWRRRGVGSGLLDAALQWARNAGAHKVALAVWPHNLDARRLYARYGFVEEGRRRRHYRRRNGELWDAIEMGLILDEASPGSSHPEDPP